MFPGRIKNTDHKVITKKPWIYCVPYCVPYKKVIVMVFSD